MTIQVVDDAMITHSCGHTCKTMITNRDVENSPSKEQWIKDKSLKPCPTCEGRQRQANPQTGMSFNFNADMPKIIFLSVDYHPSGNRTLKYRYDEGSMWADIQAPHLFANNDTASLL